LEQGTLYDDAAGPEPIDARRPNEGNGRPKGARGRRNKELEVAARSRALPLVMKIIEAAENGDMAAAKIILDRIWPKPRTAPMNCDMMPTGTPAEVRAAMLDVVQRVSRGEITSDDGAALVSMMRDILDAHSIKTLSPESDNQSLAGDVKQLFQERLTRIIEARAEPVESDSDAAD
jgi:hypothetical protein